MNARSIVDGLRRVRPAIVTVVVLAIAVGAVQVAFRSPLARMIEPPGFSILPHGAEVARLSPVTVTFAGPPNEREPEKLLELAPATAGTYAWLSPRTLLFQPEFPGLLRGSTYTVTVPARPEAGVPKSISQKFTVTGRLGIQQVIPGDGDTEVPVNAQIYVQFSRSIAPLATLSAQRAGPVITFEPAIAGTGEWLNTSIYRFVPTELAPATTYKLRVAKGLTSAADGVLEDDYGWTFSTITPGIDSIQPDANWVHAGPWQQVDVRFNQAMDPSAAAGLSVRHVESGQPVAGKTTWSNDRRLLSFNPTDRLTAGARYEIAVAGGLKGARGGTTPGERKATFTVIGPPAVARTNPADGATAAGRYGINIEFATPMDPATFDGRVRVSGFTAEELEGHVSGSENTLFVNVALKPSAPYTVELLPGATDRYGTPMGGHRFSFTTARVESSVMLALPGHSFATVYSAAVQPILYFQATNKPSVTFTLWPLTGDEGRAVMHNYGEVVGRGFSPSLPPLRTWTETVRGPENEVLLGRTALTTRGPLPEGYYFLRTDGEQYASQFAFAVVDTVLVAKISHDELLAWAVDHDTGEPLPGVTIRTTGPDITPKEVVTDEDGLASFRVPLPLPGRFADRSFILWIDGGNRNGVVSTRWYSGTSPHQLGIPAEYYARRWVGHVYTDRPIYRPGETVEYKGIVRADDDARYSLPAPDASFELTITNARGQSIKSETVRTNGFGSFAGSFQLPSDAPTGGYGIQIVAGLGAGAESVAGNSFLIAEFRRPEYQVELATAKPSYVDGDTIDARAIASFFFGGALAGASVDWSVLAEPYTMRVKGYDAYSFTDFDYYRQAVSRDAVRATGKATTGSDGAAPFSVIARLGATEGAHTFTLGASVQDTSGQAVAGSSRVTVHPATFYAGIRPAQYVGNMGTQSILDLVSVDTDGRIVGGRPVTVRVYDRQWITTKELIPGGGRIYKSEPRDTLVATLTATTNVRGEAAVAYRPTKPGLLWIVAEATDDGRRIARSATYLWVAGTGLASWQFTNDDVIKLVADKERYEVGETAQILVPAPWSGTTALVTVERGKIITRSVRQLATNSERIAIPITDRAVPDIFVSTVLYRPPTQLDPIPRYKLGYVQLPVSTATRALDVSIRPDRDQAKPGDTVRYAIKVTDNTGRGVRSEVSVAVVDSAVLSLAEERGPNGMAAFWFERGLGVNTTSSIAVSVDRWNDVIAEAPKQGKGGAGLIGAQPRQDFRNTAYWSAQVTTAEDGTASVDVTMPDTLTTWRTQVRAISGDTLVGEATNELVSTKPLLVRPALPRMLRVGDDAELRTLVRNATKADADVRVTLDAQGVTVTGDRTKTVRIRPNESVAVSWPAKAEAEGTAKITFTATGGGSLEDSALLEIPVLLDVTPETVSTGGIVGREGALEAIYLPPYANTTHGKLSVSVQSALTGSMADELGFLDPVRFEGAERVASRLIATIAVRRAERSAGLSTSLRDLAIARDVAGLVGRHRSDGGWAWCDPDCGTDPNITGWALMALGEAKRDGYTVDPAVIARATGYVLAHVNRSTDIKKPADAGQKAFLLNALASAGGWAAAQTPTRALFEQYRAALGNWGRAYLLLALSETAAPKDDQQVRALFNDLAAATIPSANGNHWEDPAAVNSGSFMTTTATTALGTLALARVQPEHQLIAQTVRWLVVSRAADGWHSSIERSLGILALTTYAVGTGELAGDFDYKVRLGEQDVLTGLVKPGAIPQTAAKSLPLAAFKPGTTSHLSFTRDYSKPGRLYYTLDLKYVTPAREIEALNRGFAISHRYSALADAAKPIASARLGEIVRVTVTVVVSSDHSYVVIEDPLPSGLEPIDARLRNVDPALKAQLEAEREKAEDRKPGAGYHAPWYHWYFSPWQHVDQRDDRVVLSATRLSKGVYEYIYYARATTPGEFFVAPAHASETYFPEVFGRSDSGRFRVLP